MIDDQEIVDKYGKFETKDSGTHQEYASGMRRDSQDGKPRFDLIRTRLQPYEEQMITRYARLLARGAEKYSARNWEDGCGEEELERAKASLLRHTEQLVAGEQDEDHAAAVWFNAQAIEYFRWRLGGEGDYLSDTERHVRAKRASEINQLALQKASEMRRRERVGAAAGMVDHELTLEAQNLKASTVTAVFDGSQGGQVSVFQSLPGETGLVMAEHDGSTYQERTGQASLTLPDYANTTVKPEDLGLDPTEFFD